MGTWSKWTEHWEEQISRHRTEIQTLGAAAGGFLIGGPVGSTAAVSAYYATKQSNDLQQAREAATIASSEVAQQPYKVGSEMAEGKLGYAGEFAVSPALSRWIPIALIFVVIMYLFFKD